MVAVEVEFEDETGFKDEDEIGLGLTTAASKRRIIPAVGRASWGGYIAPGIGVRCISAH